MIFNRITPILFAFYRVAFIAETYALIMAICELNIEVLCKSSSIFLLRQSPTVVFSLVPCVY